MTNKTNALLAMTASLLFSNLARASQSEVLLHSAQAVIESSKKVPNPPTACSIYVGSVLEHAGLSIGHFVSNDFDKAMSTHLPNWQSEAFTTDNPGGDQTVLQDFLNSAPDHTVFLAQWSRIGESGHVALIEKVSKNQYMFYQAQQGLHAPYSKAAKVSNLLYPKGQWGDRSHLRLFFE